MRGRRTGPCGKQTGPCGRRTGPCAKSFPMIQKALVADSCIYKKTFQKDLKITYGEHFGTLAYEPACMAYNTKCTSKGHSIHVVSHWKRHGEQTYFQYIYTSCSSIHNMVKLSRIHHCMKIFSKTPNAPHITCHTPLHSMTYIRHV